MDDILGYAIPEYLSSDELYPYSQATPSRELVFDRLQGAYQPEKLWALAAENNDFELARYLVEKGVDPELYLINATDNPELAAYMVLNASPESIQRFVDEDLGISSYHRQDMLLDLLLSNGEVMRVFEPYLDRISAIIPVDLSDARVPRYTDLLEEVLGYIPEDIFKRILLTVEIEPTVYNADYLESISSLLPPDLYRRANNVLRTFQWL